jgi:hypothetical protein
MLEFFLAHVAIPFLAGLVVLAIVIVSAPRPISWEVANDAGLDMTILSIGATGGLFLNHKLQEHLGGQTPLFGILAVLVNLLLSCMLVYRKRWKPENERDARFRNMLPDLAVGAVAMCLTMGLFAFGYMSGGGGR